MTHPDKWVPQATVKPTMLPDTLVHGRWRSRWVLVALPSKEVCVARLEQWEGEDARWVQWGRDGYDCEPTHWMGLPNPPEDTQ